MPAGYVANWGNDLNNGLTWATAKRSIQAAKDANLNPCYLKGYFNEPFVTEPDYEGGIIDGIKFAYLNLNLRGSKTIFQNINLPNIHQADKSLYRFCARINFSNIKTNNSELLVFHNVAYLSLFKMPRNSTFFSNNQLHESHFSGHVIGWSNKNIIANHRVNIYINLSYTLIINCAVKFLGGTTNETVFSYPTGATDTDKLQNLRSRMATVYGGSANGYLVGCKYYSGTYNDIFVDADNGNFYLKNTPGNPALNMSYEGSYVGAKPPAAGIFAIAAASARTNIAADGLVTNQAQNAQAEWNTIDIGRVTEITSLDAIANLAYRNGLALNTDAYVGAPITAGTNVLTAGKQYQVIDALATGGSIVLNNAGASVLTAFKTFTAVDEGGGAGLGFSSVDNLTCREIDINQFDEKIELLCSRTDATLASATAIKLKLYETPMVNVNANNEPTHGNGNVGYTVGTAVKLFTRFVKVKAYIQANQLYAR